MREPDICFILPEPLLSHGCDLTLGEHPFDTNSTIFFLRELWGEQGDFYAESKLSYRFTVLWCFLATMKYMSEGQWKPGLLLCTFFHEFPRKQGCPFHRGEVRSVCRLLRRKSNLGLWGTIHHGRKISVIILVQSQWVVQTCATFFQICLINVSYLFLAPF